MANILKKIFIFIKFIFGIKGIKPLLTTSKVVVLPLDHIPF